MSHFAVMVVGHPDDLETILAPFNENEPDAEGPYREAMNDWTFWYGLADRFPQLRAQQPLEITDQRPISLDGELQLYIAPPTPAELVALFDDGDEEPRWSADEFDGRVSILCRYNRKSKWDWWTLGGRWSCCLKLRDGASGTTEPPRPTDPDPEPRRAGWCDSAVKRDIDFDGMRLIAETEARAYHRKVVAAMDGAPWPPRWRDFLEAGKAEQLTIEEIRKRYHAREDVQTMNARLRAAEVQLWLDDAVELFDMTEDAYAENARVNAGVFFAFLDAEGVWHENGRMGWFGMTFDEKDEVTWVNEFHALLEKVPADAHLSIVDCHI